MTLNTIGWNVGHNNPSTSHAMHVKAALRAGKDNHLIFWMIYDADRGQTDDEIELLTGKAHQSVSATRYALMKKGYIEDSGLRRKTRYGNEAIVWNVTYQAQCRIDAGLEPRL